MSQRSRGENCGKVIRRSLRMRKSNPKIVTDEKRWKIWKSNQNSVMNEELVQNSVMIEDMVQNSVMDGKFVKNIVMNAEIDPKVVLGLSMFKIGGWNSLQSINQNSLEEFIDKNEPWLLIGIPSRDPFFATQILGKTLCEFRSENEEIDVTS